MSIADYLRACADRVRRGWCQGALEKDGNVCALGAIITIVAESLQTSWDDRLSTKSLQMYLLKALGLSRVEYGSLTWHSLTDVTDISLWNDKKDQTAENVALAFELAALIAEQEEVHYDQALTRARSEPVVDMAG